MKLRIDHIAKIEGHASFTADIINGNVRSAKIKIDEGARLFEGIMKDRQDVEVPELGSRICGVCPVVHTFAGFKSVESAYQTEVREPALSLRKLMMLGQLINSHALHLFFFSLSDFFGFKSDLQLINQYSKESHDALKVRGVGNELVELIGGRTIHPLTPCIGGLSKAPSSESLKKLLKDCREIMPTVLQLADLFLKLNYPKFNRKRHYVSLFNEKEYAIYEGQIKVGGMLVEAKNFLSRLEEFQGPDKVAKRTHFEKTSYMVGALARLNNNHEQLNSQAKKILAKSGLKFPCYNPFYNILAQAIEIVHCFEEAVKILEPLTKSELKIEEVEIKDKNGQGIGAIEAPRGTLFYDLKIKDGVVEKINIITPTAQNLASLEDDLEEFEHVEGFQKLNTKGKKEKIKMLIRAYDPCVTCAVH